MTDEETAEYLREIEKKRQEAEDTNPELAMLLREVRDQVATHQYGKNRN